MSYTTTNNGKTAAYQPYGDVYGNESRSQPQQDYGRSRYDPQEEMVRRQQMHDYYRPASPQYDRVDPRSDLSRQNIRTYNSRYRRDQSAPGRYEDRGRRSRDSDYSSRSSSRSRDSREDDQRTGRSPGRRGYFKRQRTQSEVAKQGQQGQQQQQRRYDGDVGGVVKKNLDMSENGLFAAAVGAGFGAITARRFGSSADHFKEGTDSKSKDRWITIGGAVAGGLLANAAENRYKKWSNSGQEEGKE